MSLFGGIFGDSKQTTVTNQNTTVNVTTNPQIAVGVDTKPIADAVQQVAQQDQALVGQVAANGAQQAGALASANQALAAAITNQGAGFASLVRELAIVAGAGFLIFFFHKKA